MCRLRGEKKWDTWLQFKILFIDFYVFFYFTSAFSTFWLRRQDLLFILSLPFFYIMFHFSDTFELSLGLCVGGSWFYRMKLERRVYTKSRSQLVYYAEGIMVLFLNHLHQLETKIRKCKYQNGKILPFLSKRENIVMTWSRVVEGIFYPLIRSSQPHLI